MFLSTPRGQIFKAGKCTLLSPGIKLGKTKGNPHSRQGFPQICDMDLCLLSIPGPLGSSAKAEAGSEAGREVITEEKPQAQNAWHREAGERPTEQNLQAWPQGPAPLSPIPAPQCPNPKEMPPSCGQDKRASTDQGPRGVSEEGAQAWSPGPEMCRVKRWGKHRKCGKGS